MSKGGSKFRRVLASVKSVVLSIVVEFIYLLPPGTFKHKMVGNLVRHKVYNRKCISKLLASYGEVVLHGGIWRLETVLYWVEAVGDKGELIAVEADTESSEILSYDLYRRDIHNVTIINKGLTSYKGIAKLQTSSYSRINQLKVHNHFISDDEYAEEIDVAVDRLDNIIESTGKKIDLVCLSISGAEKDAIDGMPALLEKGCRFWVSSIFADREDQADSPFKKVVAVLKEYGYNIYLTPVDKNKMGNRSIYAFKSPVAS